MNAFSFELKLNSDSDFADQLFIIITDMDIQECAFVMMPDGSIRMCSNIKHTNDMECAGGTFIFNRMHSAVILLEQVIIRATN